MQRNQALIALALVGTTLVSAFVLKKVFDWLSKFPTAKKDFKNSQTSTIKEKQPEETKKMEAPSSSQQKPVNVLRVVLIGQQAFGADVYKKLKTSEFCKIIAVSAPKPKEGATPDPLWKIASEDNANPVETKTLSEEEPKKKWKELNADLCVMAFVTDIIPDEVLKYPKHGSIQYHPSLLPLHRGISSINWAVIKGDKETGLSIFWVDHLIDHGPILLQEKITITPTDTVKTVYFDKLYPMGVEAITKSVKLVAEGSAPKIEQNHKIATYEPPCKQKLTQIRWFEDGQTVYNLIRGCDPSPGAWTTYEGGQKLSIFDCEYKPTQHEVGWCGKVTSIHADGFNVRLNGGTLVVKRVQVEGGKKIAASEWAKTCNPPLKEGFRFSLD